MLVNAPVAVATSVNKDGGTLTNVANKNALITTMFPRGILGTLSLKVLRDSLISKVGANTSSSTNK